MQARKGRHQHDGSSNMLREYLDCELIIGIVGAVGTKFSDVVQHLKEQLTLAGYEMETIKVSKDIIPNIVAVEAYSTSYERFSNLMKAGNEARGLNAGFDDVLALGVAARIRELRVLHFNGDFGEGQPRFKQVYIVDSLKRPEEVEALRTIYGEGFVLIGVFESEESRVRNLSGQGQMTQPQAEDLVQRDFDEKENPHGQRVNETFHLSDFFVEIGERRNDLKCNVQRMVEIWFGHPYRTPTFDEYAMYIAYSAALRSADLSRQVGAVLARDSQILATGANECPKAMGGLYWPSSSFDSDCKCDEDHGRDYLRGIDSNREGQLEMIAAIINRLGEKIGTKAEELQRLLDASPIADLTEYGRVVHAEMEALLSCARLGISTSKTTLYTTTFPCHNCAKHMIAAGVERVVYVEPYAKSRAMRHHSDAIAGKADSSSSKVLFEPFTGIGPRRFFDLFSISRGNSYSIRRKDRSTGKVVDWRLQTSRLRIQMRPFTYLDAEIHAAKLFKERVQKKEDE